ncbi:hypothetical protein CCR75_004706 [Bremia lactucae]|uniref:Uncharacterized protein n=1 Tax=Bremia lactucae TaxID=4779 RepID=A0A976IJP5_BRELC|nr:hypothetical protein CCR75_004706 [Bremia lactucae]
MASPEGLTVTVTPMPHSLRLSHCSTIRHFGMWRQGGLLSEFEADEAVLFFPVNDSHKPNAS